MAARAPRDNLCDDFSVNALRPVTLPIQEIALETAARKISRQLTVFVAGPEISRDLSPEELSKQSAASILRLRIYEHVRDVLQHRVIFGEHRGVKEMGDDIYGTQSSFALTELGMLQDDNTDAVIIIPSSAGSFCELGAWSQYESICRKMLIICDKNFESHQSYMRLGAVKMATDVGAKVIWIELEDLNSAVQEVSDFVSAHHDLALRRSRTRAK